VLSDKEKAAWQSFEKVSNGFLGNFKVANFREFVQDLDGFVWTAGVQYVAENALFIFTPGFLSIKFWRLERQTWGALPSRHFSDGAQIHREMERCNFRWLLLDDKKGCSWNKIPPTGQKDTSLRSVIFCSYLPYILLW